MIATIICTCILRSVRCTCRTSRGNTSETCSGTAKSACTGECCSPFRSTADRIRPALRSKIFTFLYKFIAHQSTYRPTFCYIFFRPHPTIRWPDQPRSSWATAAGRPVRMGGASDGPNRHVSSADTGNARRQSFCVGAGDAVPCATATSAFCPVCCRCRCYSFWP